ncbi:kelch repeat-containing protein [Geothrix sp.]|jgi:hypothetical protein|uniref:kelch repeat-containing protein n=1 Tax=Geothrix sp. TaxID=1962974 RepID=UPI0025BB88C9|nr:kelch repeat-containing protein [Geothrix sp.]
MRAIGRGLWAMFLGLALLGLGCRETVELPTGLSYGTNPATYTTGTAIAPNTPTHGGGAIDAYSVSPALPVGLALDAKSGVITGTPTAATAIASYTVTGTNSAGSATVSLSITVNDPILPITITTQPADQSIVVGQTATFTVVAAGTGTLSYQWLRNAVAISGATSASYTTPAAVLADDASTFSVQVSDTFGGRVTSSLAKLTVVAKGGPGTSLVTGSLVAPRAFHTATLLANGKVLVVGGYDGTFSLASAELYDPTTGTFKATGSLVTPRQSHTATLLVSGKVLISGGSSFGTALASAELYDPATGTFTATGSLGAARSDHTATLLTDGRVLVACGRNLGSYLATAELYDPAVGTFAATANAPLASRATHTATLLANGKVLLAGGFRSSSLATAELYDPAGGTFTATGSLASARAYHTATLLPNGKVLIVGGAATLVTELYDPATGAFAASGNLVTARDHWHTAVLLPTGAVYIAGGVGAGSPGAVLSAAELFDPATGLCIATGNLTALREAHTATALPGGKVLVAGGGGFGYLASAELYY